MIYRLEIMNQGATLKFNMVEPAKAEYEGTSSQLLIMCPLGSVPQCSRDRLLLREWSLPAFIIASPGSLYYEHCGLIINANGCLYLRKIYLLSIMLPIYTPKFLNSDPCGFSSLHLTCQFHLVWHVLSSQHHHCRGRSSGGGDSLFGDPQTS